jgi:hypothetical protein
MAILSVEKRIPAAAEMLNGAELLSKSLKQNHLQLSFKTIMRNVPDVLSYNVVGENDWFKNILNEKWLLVATLIVGSWRWFS